MSDLVNVMLLAVDVGNTQTVIGVYEDDELQAMWRLSTDRNDTVDELRIALAALLAMAHISLETVNRAALASVVPGLTASWTEAIVQMTGCSPIVCTAETAGSAFETTYPNPGEIGSDRIADTVAARHRYGAPVVVVDFGTATNIEVVDGEGRFVGGIIAPGIQTGAQALFSEGAQLAAVNLTKTSKRVIGRSTAEAIRSGIIDGEVARVDGLVRRIFDELGSPAPVIGTGGLAHLVADASETISIVDPELTLEGLRLIAEAAR